MNKRKLLSIVLALVVLVSLMQPTYAKTKYTKTEKKLAETIACFQEDNLVDPDAFRIRRIHRVKYKLDKDVYSLYEAYGLLKDSKTIKWEVDYSAKNSLGGRVAGTLYISSTYYYFTEDAMSYDDYTDYTDYSKYETSKTFTKNVKKLAKKYYNEM